MSDETYMTVQQCLMLACSPRKRYSIREDCFAAMMPSLSMAATWLRSCGCMECFWPLSFGL